MAAAHLRDVGRAEPVHHRLYPARLVRDAVIALEMLDVTRGTQQRERCPPADAPQTPEWSGSRL